MPVNRRLILLLLAVALHLCLARIALGAETVLVLPFPNNSGVRALDGFGDALAYELRQSINSSGGLALPLDRTNRVLQEAGLSNKAVTSADDAAKAAKAALADRVVYGELASNGRGIALKVAVLHGGKQVFSQSFSGTARDPFRLLGQVVAALAQQGVSAGRQKPGHGKRPSSDAFVLSGQALQALQTGNLPLARDLARQLVSEAPKYSLGYVVLGSVALMESDPEASNWLAKAVDANPKGVEERNLYGLALMMRGDPVAAEAQLRPLADQGHPYAALAMAMITSQKKDYAAALAYTDILKKTIPNDPTALGMKAVTLTLSGSLEEAKPLLDKGLEIFPDSFYLHEALGLYHVLKRDLYAGILQYDRAAELIESYAGVDKGYQRKVVHSMLAVLCNSQASLAAKASSKRYADSLKEAFWHLDIAWDKSMLATPVRLLEVLTRTSGLHPEIAVGLLDDLRKEHGARAPWQALKGWLEYSNGKPGGMALIKGVLDKNPLEPCGLMIRGEALLMDARKGDAGSGRAAYEAYEKLVELNGMLSDYAASMVEALLAAGDADEAAELGQALSDRCPDNPRVRLLTIAAQALSRDLDGARHNMERMKEYLPPAARKRSGMGRLFVARVGQQSLAKGTAMDSIVGCALLTVAEDPKSDEAETTAMDKDKAHVLQRNLRELRGL